MAVVNSLVKEYFIVEVYLQNKFLKVEMLGQRVPAFIILINAAKLLYVEIMPVTTLTPTPLGESLFPHPHG